MKAAFPVWNDRIAPVFDVARQVRLVEIEAGCIISETDESLPENLLTAKAIRLAEHGVELLVCGAISRPLQAIVASYGIRVVPYVAGEIGEIVQACLAGTLGRDVFAMPGCCGRGRRRGFGRASYPSQEDFIMRGRKGGGMGSGGGRGMGGQGRGQGAGRMGGPFAAGPEGACVCPQCGYQEPHERGVPCTQKMCPKCGIAMSRQ